MTGFSDDAGCADGPEIDGGGERCAAIASPSTPTITCWPPRARRLQRVRSATGQHPRCIKERLCWWPLACSGCSHGPERPVGTGPGDLLASEPARRRRTLTDGDVAMGRSSPRCIGRATRDRARPAKLVCLVEVGLRGGRHTT